MSDSVRHNKQSTTEIRFPGIEKVIKSGYYTTMNEVDDRIFFVAALKAELKKHGYGAQAELSKKSGVSKSLINDIVNGRTYGAERKRRALATALGYPDYEDFLNLGRKTMGKPLVKRTFEPSPVPAENMPELLLELLLENRSLRIERDAKNQEIAELRQEVSTARTLCDPTVPVTPAAPVAKRRNEN